jgi:hypothetical protein
MTNINLTKIISWLTIFMPFSIAIGKGLADVNLSLIAFLFIVSSILNKDFSWLKERWVQVALISWAYIIIRSLFVDDISFSLTKPIPWIRFILFAVCMQFLLSKESGLVKKIWISLALVVCFLTADTLLQFFTGYDIVGRPYFDEGNGTVRLTGPYKKKIIGVIITTLSVSVISLLYYKARNSKNMVQILSSGFLVIAIYLAIFFSGERSAFIQINIAILLMLCFLNSNTKIILGFISVVGITILGAWVIHPPLIDRQIHSVINAASNLFQTPYGMLWVAGIKTGLSHPIFGVGARYFEQHCNQYTDFCSYHPHSIYIEWFAEFGIVGLGLFLFLLYSLLKRSLLIYKQLTSDEMKYLAFGIMVTIFIKLLPLPSSGFFKNWYATPLWFMIGMSLLFRNQAISKNN